MLKGIIDFSLKNKFLVLVGTLFLLVGGTLAYVLQRWLDGRNKGEVA